MLDDNVRSNGAPPPPGRPILTVGDSFTFGDEVDDADTWPARRVARVFACAERHGLATLHLFEPLRELGAADPARLRRLYKIHMTPAGSDFVAGEIQRFLEARRAGGAAR